MGGGGAWIRGQRVRGWRQGSKETKHLGVGKGHGSEDRGEGPGDREEKRQSTWVGGGGGH
jgi:hypothetical protein